MNLFLDMDGTIADLYSVPDWLYKLRAEDVTPYKQAKTLGDWDAICRNLRMLQNQGWRIVILTALAGGNPSPKYCKQIKIAKVNWLTEHKLPWDEIIFCGFDESKTETFLRLFDPSEAGILIDDSPTHRNEWNAVRRRDMTAIDPTAINIAEYLSTLIGQ